MGHLKKKNFQEDSWQENYSDGQINSITKNIREDQKGIGDGKKEND